MYRTQRTADEGERIMIKRIIGGVRNGWDWYGGMVVVVAVGVAILGGSVFAIGSWERATLKYNCKLDTYPSFRIAFWINQDPYAYNPVRFCDELKERMKTA
jgi:hypothetical protein